MIVEWNIGPGVTLPCQMLISNKAIIVGGASYCLTALVQRIASDT
jgi:hypothetical protein